MNATVGETSLLVVKLESLAGQDKFTLYVNPDINQPEPDSDLIKTDLDLGAAREIHLYQTGEYSIDEIRIGDTFGDVTPVSVPEPNSLIFLLVTIACVSIAWRLTF